MVLDNHNVVSSIQGASTRETEQIWKELFPNEPYEFDSNGAFSKKLAMEGNYTKYDLLSAVKRQSPFFYQVLFNPVAVFSFIVSTRIERIYIFFFCLASKTIHFI